jgi:hypothetical protein
LSLALRYAHPALGSAQKALDVFYRWDEYVALPLGQVAAFQLQGGISASDRGAGARYHLGGVPSQDLVRAIINSTRTGYAWLRGYPDGAVAGDQYHLLNFEYRVPIQNIEKGLATLPFYFRRVHLAGLVDVGNAFSGPFRPADFKVAVGAALRLDMTFGFYVPGTFDLGYARGLSAGGVDEVWLQLTGGI